MPARRSAPFTSIVNSQPSRRPVVVDHMLDHDQMRWLSSLVTVQVFVSPVAIEPEQSAEKLAV